MIKGIKKQDESFSKFFEVRFGKHDGSQKKEVPKMSEQKL